MAKNSVTIPKSHKGLKAVYITPSEEGLLRRTSHPKGSPQPKKGPGGLLMMDGEEERDRDFARKHGVSLEVVRKAGGASMSTRKLKEVTKARLPAPKKASAPAAAPATGGGGGGSSVRVDKEYSGAGGSYTDYVNKYPDLKAAFAKSGAKSAEAWGKAHWDRHGSGEGRSVGGAATTASTAAATRTVGAWTGSETAPDVRGGYNPGEGVDMTNTNPSYWASAVRYFTAHPRGNPTTGELGIWIPNLEKEGNERVALAAIAGGVTAHVGSNYSNNTIDNAYAQKLHRDRGDTVSAESTYNTGGAEKVIRLAGTHRDGVKTETGYAMGSTAPSEHGVHILGGEVVKGAGADYVKGGGDFGGLLSSGDTITGDWLTGILGGMDKDGMRLGGTYAPVRGATGSGVGAGGTATGMGTFYGGGTDPLAKMPGVADYTPYIDPNSVFGGRSGNAAVRSGLLYQPMASDYGAKMAGAGMPVFSPTGGLLGSPGGMGGVKIGGVGAPTYGASPSGFSPAAIAALGGGTATVGTGAGLRGGMTAGSHSTHLGAYQLADGSWVWGDMPSEGGHDPTGGGIAHSVSPMSSLASSPTLGPGAHPMAVAMALAGTMAPTSHTVAPATYSHEDLEAALGAAGAAAAAEAAAEAEAEAAAEAVGMGGIGAL